LISPLKIVEKYFLIDKWGRWMYKSHSSLKKSQASFLLLIILEIAEQFFSFIFKPTFNYFVSANILGS
jgi:hypothetical protein